MLRLNLLPWRERQRLAALRRFQLALIGSLLLALAGVIMLDQLARQRGQQQLAAIAERQADVARLDIQLQQLKAVQGSHEDVMAQSAALQALRNGQNLLPRMFAELEQALGASLQLTEMSIHEGQLRLLGLAASPAVVAQFIRDLQQSRRFDALELKHIRAVADGDEFLLLARLSALEL
ncbi:PilN domain-containing protein [Pseudomonas shirazensis]|uniref:PilN domain-containing protein n=1 Tax=Pseudomonas shirazensis TaxID=2745494 RepID=UPI003D28D3AB